MSVFSKIFGKKKTVDTSNPQHMQPQAMPVAAPRPVQNEQANPFDFEVIDVLPDGQQVAEVILNVDTESKSRSHMTLGDLKESNVGHTWLTVRPLNGKLPADLDQQVQPQTRALVSAHGETAMGFWPVTVRTQATEGKKISEEQAEEIAEDNEKNKAEMQIRTAKGLTRGGGGITREEAPEYDLHSTVFGKDTAGRVEEPDDAHSPKGRKVYRITRKQFRDMYRYIDAHRNHKYNLYTYNCTTFASHALRAAGQTVPMEGMTMPTSLYEAMYKEAKQYAKDAEKAKKRGKKVGKSSVELLKLAEGEAHRKTGKGKEGPNGKDVRVKGVEKFDMPMFTDPAEVVLRQVINKGNASKEDKEFFSLYLLKDCHLRTAAAAEAYADEALNVGLMVEDAHDAVIKFYNTGYNLVQDPAILTERTHEFSEYIILICSMVPTEKTFNALMDGKTLSAKHDKDKLTKQVMWNVLKSEKTGDEFVQYIKPLVELKFWGTMSGTLDNAFIEGLKHYTTNYRPSDLKRIQYLVRDIFAGVEDVYNAVHDYFKRYYNVRIQERIMTEQDYQDAIEFREITQMERIDKALPKIQKSIERSKKHAFYSTINGKDGQAVSMVKSKFVKAKKQPNAPKPDENEVIGEAYLNVDTAHISEDRETVSRSRLVGDVGHTWLTLKARPQEGQRQGTLPADVEAEMQKTATGQVSVNIMRAKGETAAGFYPLINHFVKTDGEQYQQNTSEAKKAEDAERNLTHQAEMDVRRYKNFTLGSGSVRRDETQYTGYKPVLNVTGRVEEPDDSHTPKARKVFKLTRKQFKKMYQYIDSHRNHNYSLERYNCTTFATHALREAGYAASGSRFGVCYPAKLYRELYDEAKRDARHHRDSKVKLLKLQDNESHGEFRPGKIGENGADVRVKGVDSFDMVTKYTDEAEVILRKMQLVPDKKESLKFGFEEEMFRGLGERTVGDATRIVDEALRRNIIDVQKAENIKYLYTHFGHLRNHTESFKTLPLEQRYDYLNAMHRFVSKVTFSRFYINHLNSIARDILSYKLGSEEYKYAVKILDELADGMSFDDIIEDALDQIDITPDVALSLIHLNSQMIYGSSNGTLRIVYKAHQNNADAACKYIMSVYQMPETTQDVRVKLNMFFINLIPELQNKQAYIPSITELKNKGVMDGPAYDEIMKELQK